MTSPNDIIVINLKRYGYQGNQVFKNNEAISVPLEISIDHQSYEMFAFVSHCDSQIAASGHYRAYVNCRTGWYEFDDEKVSTVTPTQLKELTSYGYYYCYRRLNKVPKTKFSPPLIDQWNY